MIIVEPGGNPVAEPVEVEDDGVRDLPDGWLDNDTYVYDKETGNLKKIIQHGGAVLEGAELIEYLRAKGRNEEEMTRVTITGSPRHVHSPEDYPKSDELLKAWEEAERIISRICKRYHIGNRMAKKLLLDAGVNPEEFKPQGSHKKAAKTEPEKQPLPGSKELEDALKESGEITLPEPGQTVKVFTAGESVSMGRVSHYCNGILFFDEKNGKRSFVPINLITGWKPCEPPTEEVPSEPATEKVDSLNEGTEKPVDLPELMMLAYQIEGVEKLVRELATSVTAATNRVGNVHADQAQILERLMQAEDELFSVKRYLENLQVDQVADKRELTEMLDASGRTEEDRFFAFANGLVELYDLWLAVKATRKESA